MSDYLFQYQAVEPTTWLYLSSLLMIGLFFKFSRLWSVRNVDLLLLIMLAPGLLMVYYGQKQEGPPQGPAVARSLKAEQPESTDDPEPEPQRPALDAEDSSARAETAGEVNPEDEEVASKDEKVEDWASLEILGFAYLFGVGGLWLTRLLLDPLMVRRPLLEPNLSLGGLTFIGCSLFMFLSANVVADPVKPKEPDTTEDYRITLVAPASRQGPGYELLSWLPASLSKSFCLIGQLAVVSGMGLVGYWHFRNLLMGVGAATLYLMLPYTSLLTGRVEHVLPAATMVWAVLMYRRPLIAGTLIGLASGLVYYPFFLLPLWASFYWHRGFRRFSISFVLTLTVLAAILVFSPGGDLVADLQRMFGLHRPAMNDLGGIWNSDADGIHGHYRLPVLVGFCALSCSMALWPAQKNLGTLLSCSAAIMVAAQFWHAYGGGTYMAWYLPLTLLTIFRPNLEDRVAVTVLTESWLPRRFTKLPNAA